MFNFLRNKNKPNIKRLLKQYRSYKESKEYFAQLFVKKYCKEATSGMIIIIRKIFIPKGFDYRKLQFGSVDFELIKRKTRMKKPELKGIYSNDVIKEITEALKWKNDIEEVKARRSESNWVGFIANGHFEKKNHKKKPSMFVSSAPQEIKNLEFNDKRLSNRLWPEAIQYLNPDYLNYDDKNYKVVCVEKASRGSPSSPKRRNEKMRQCFANNCENTSKLTQTSCKRSDNAYQ